MIENTKHIAHLFMDMHGIDVSQYDQSFLNKSLQKRITETHCHSVEEYCTFLEHNTNEGENLLDVLHISYSEFFRNPLTFSVLERIIVPSLILKKKNTKHKEIRIWSAACAAGQEAYSIAIVLEELKNGNRNKFDYRIFASDQSESKIDEARKGQYPAAAFNNLTMKRSKQWFTNNDETYSVKPELKEHIEFTVFDLFSDQLSSPPASIFGDFDLVFCANLLFYYNRKHREIIIRKIRNCLSTGGFLVTGEAEREIIMNHHCHTSQKKCQEGMPTHGILYSGTPDTTLNEVFPQSAIFQIKNGIQLR